MNKKRLILGIILFDLLVLVPVGVVLYAFNAYQKPSKLAQEKIVIIERGTGFSNIVRQLEREGVITDARIFMIPALLRGDHSRVQAGEYAFTPSVSSKQVMDKLISGDVVVHSVTLLEGWTVEQIADALMKEDALTGDVPQMAEGTLLPDTLHFTRGTERTTLIRQMQKKLQDVLQAEWNSRAEDLPLASPKDALILASIVERETGVAGERAKVAGVYINRLRIGMRLQADPTVAYGIEQAQGAPMERPLTGKDLQVDSPFNTYTRDGLPPTPIANPSRAAIEAALKPEATDALYFVATGTGGHRFARTLAEHNANVNAYRKALREQAAANK